MIFHDSFWVLIKTHVLRHIITFISIVSIELDEFLLFLFQRVDHLTYASFDRNLQPVPRNFQSYSLEDYGQVFGGLTSRAPQ